MKNFPLYVLPIKYMILFSIAILASGLWLFLLSTPTEKSLHNIIEVATPHFFAMGILIFIVAHFLLFSVTFKIKYTLLVSRWLYTFMFLNIISSFSLALAWIKLLALGGFLFLFLIVLGMVWVSI